MTLLLLIIIIINYLTSGFCSRFILAGSDDVNNLLTSLTLISVENLTLRTYDKHEYPIYKVKTCFIIKEHSIVIVSLYFKPHCPTYSSSSFLLSTGSTSLPTFNNTIIHIITAYIRRNNTILIGMIINILPIRSNDSGFHDNVFGFLLQYPIVDFIGKVTPTGNESNK